LPGVTIPLLPGDPPELVVFDELTRCPYLTEKTARMPLRLPLRELSRVELETRLAEGDRRQGVVLYRTDCPACRACEPIRIDVSAFTPSRNERRVKKLAERALRYEIGPPENDPRRVELYNLHRIGRGLADDPTPIDARSYQEFLVASCCESFELRYYSGSDLLGIAVTDRGEDSLSAVYCYYDPAHAALGIGTYSILTQIELCRAWNLRWLYLGLYIAESDRMRYKARFFPHERLLGGRWVRFDRG
jgi:arginine-tRNA-protein transferase